MTTLFTATLQLADHLGVLRFSDATGGTTTTIVDTTRDEGDNEFVGGTAWIITDAGGSSDAPEGEFARITAWTSASTFTVTPAFSAAPAAGDRYGFTAHGYPLDVLINAINTQIIKYRIEKWDLTSLDVVTGQTEYTLPSGIYEHNLIGVWESTQDDADDNRWVPINYRVQQAATGSQETIVIETPQVGVDNDIGLQYWAYHDRVYSATSVIDDLIPLPRILDDAAAHAELIRMRNYDSDQQLGIEMLKMYREDARIAKLEHPVRYSKKRGNLNEMGSTPQREARVSVPSRA